ncbi:hypothetical protein B0H16DRAFT_1631587 [Mycena metata]|uniref:Uncharacterized protein n=1 Tax=Mycena metata TaxID=1033252 RepID=A0AAD7H0N1_9AGAR|nr:hypothetical protein B0H16DRAFT_1631587 [Mycena metata]
MADIAAFPLREPILRLLADPPSLPPWPISLGVFCLALLVLLWWRGVLGEVRAAEAAPPTGLPDPILAALIVQPTLADARAETEDADGRPAARQHPAAVVQREAVEPEEAAADDEEEQQAALGAVCRRHRSVARSSTATTATFHFSCSFGGTRSSSPQRLGLLAPSALGLSSLVHRDPPPPSTPLPPATMRGGPDSRRRPSRVGWSVPTSSATGSEPSRTRAAASPSPPSPPPCRSLSWVLSDSRRTRRPPRPSSLPSPRPRPTLRAPLGPRTRGESRG